MKTESYYYYEEKQRDGTWIAAYALYRFSRATCIAAMEDRKRNNPRAMLRMVGIRKVTLNWREV